MKEKIELDYSHEEKMLVLNVKQKKLKMDYEITQTGQHYAFFIAVTAIVCASLVVYFGVSEWSAAAGAAIGTMGSGMGFVAGKKMLTRSMENLGKQTESEEIGRY